MHRSIKLARKVSVALVGLPLLVLGIILIPLPGPGLLVSLLALLILSTEFDWANKYAEKGKKELKEIIEKSKAKGEKISKS